MVTKGPLLRFVIAPQEHTCQYLPSCVRHNRPGHSGYNAYPSICIVSSRHKALWNTYPKLDQCGSGVHQGTTIPFFVDLPTGPHFALA